MSRGGDARPFDIGMSTPGVAERVGDDPPRAGARRVRRQPRARTAAMRTPKAFCSAFKTSASSRPAPCTVRMWSSSAGGGGASCRASSAGVDHRPAGGRAAGRRPAHRHRRFGVEEKPIEGIRRIVRVDGKRIRERLDGDQARCNIGRARTSPIACRGIGAPRGTAEECVCDFSASSSFDSPSGTCAPTTARLSTPCVQSPLSSSSPYSPQPMRCASYDHHGTAPPRNRSVRRGQLGRRARRGTRDGTAAAIDRPFDESILVDDGGVESSSGAILLYLATPRRKGDAAEETAVVGGVGKQRARQPLRRRAGRPRARHGDGPAGIRSVGRLEEILGERSGWSTASSRSPTWRSART